MPWTRCCDVTSMATSPEKVVQLFGNWFLLYRTIAEYQAFPPLMSTCSGRCQLQKRDKDQWHCWPRTRNRKCANYHFRNFFSIEKVYLILSTNWKILLHNSSLSKTRPLPVAHARSWSAEVRYRWFPGSKFLRSRKKGGQTLRNHFQNAIKGQQADTLVVNKL